MISNEQTSSTAVFTLHNLLDIGSGTTNEDQQLFIEQANAIIRRVLVMNHNRSLIGDLTPANQRSSGITTLLQTLQQPLQPYVPTVQDPPTCKIEAVWRILSIFFLFPKSKQDVIHTSFFDQFDERYQLKLCGNETTQALHPIEFVISEYQHHLRTVNTT